MTTLTVKLSKKEKKALDSKIERTFYRVAQGVQINVLDIGKIFQAGYEAIAQGFSDAQFEARIAEVVSILKRN